MELARIPSRTVLGTTCLAPSGVAVRLNLSELARDEAHFLFVSRKTQRSPFCAFLVVAIVVRRMGGFRAWLRYLIDSGWIILLVSWN
jgi:hypothetical protein